MTNAQAGHGATIAVAFVTPGTFLTVAELNGDIEWPQLSRPETDVTPHQDKIDSWVLGVITRGALKFSVNFLFDDDTHDASAGLYSLMKSNQRVGVRMRGPSGTSGSDEWIMSGQVQMITQKSPVRQGARTCEVTFRMSGSMIIDGVLYAGTL